MLSLSLVEQIVDLLNEGELSQRRIAARVGVSRGTVASIASGRRGLFGRDPESDDDAVAGPFVAAGALPQMWLSNLCAVPRLPGPGIPRE